MQPGKQTEIAFQEKKSHSLSQFEQRQENVKQFLAQENLQKMYDELNEKLGWAVSVAQAQERISKINEEAGFELAPGTYSSFRNNSDGNRNIKIDILSPDELRKKYNIS